MHHEEEPLKSHETPGRQTQQSNQLSLSHQLEWTQSNTQQNIEQLQNLTMGVTINNESIAKSKQTKVVKKMI